MKVKSENQWIAVAFTFSSTRFLAIILWFVLKNKVFLFIMLDAAEVLAHVAKEPMLICSH